MPSSCNPKYSNTISNHKIIKLRLDADVGKDYFKIKFAVTRLTLILNKLDSLINDDRHIRAVLISNLLDILAERIVLSLGDVDLARSGAFVGFLLISDTKAALKVLQSDSTKLLLWRRCCCGSLDLLRDRRAV